ncbi:hypothetical protein GPJ56_007195 [Histomonas meleagridis]|uniref:uncharacterized protein n=1 Tax=Histomonas meleagridis TaxID=135588 RepID=UPI00355A766A|nr:hypothetical protein GPJ56_007195 [Histomonas meleagridis]KAH0800119.1 hypothetical protein GO595_007231 [Histomonas meleagridis]
MNYTNDLLTISSHSLRYIAYNQFLSQTPFQFNRVLHTDSFDVFFQADPFTPDIDPNYLYFVMEQPLIMNSTWNSGWLVRAYNESVSKSLGKYLVSCSGTLIGGMNQFQIYLKTLLGHKPFWLNGRHSLDQAYHNYLLHTKAFENNGIHPKYLGCNSTFLTMHYCSRGKFKIQNDRFLGPDGTTIPSVVHQYNRYGGGPQLINRLCGGK